MSHSAPTAGTCCVEACGAAMAEMWKPYFKEMVSVADKSFSATLAQ